MLNRLYKQILRPKQVLFYRDLSAHTGGHQKVADYFGHLESSFYFHPEISFSARTRWDISNPWFPTYQHKSVAFNPIEYDAVFLAGLDWQVYLPFARELNKPVINLIQHVRHADPKSDVFEFLSQPAVRICVSQQVASAINATGIVNGPVFTIPNGVDLPILPHEKLYDLIILGIKQPDLAKQLELRLESKGFRLLVVDTWIPWKEWLGLLAKSRMALLLPNFTEGFYLPALEAMHYCDQIIVPDCIGNRDFCKYEQNCLMPAYDIDSILASIDCALVVLDSKEELARFKHNAAETVSAHSLANERRAFLKIMGNIKNLWPV